MTKQILLTQSKVTLVDDDVYVWASRHKWHLRRVGNAGYAVRWSGGRPFRKLVFLHREIMQPPAAAEVDHINGNGLDNRRANLRLCAHAENQRNYRRPSSNTSGYKGVHWNKGSGRWRAQIRVDGRLLSLGYFVDAEEAARAYDEAARKYHGEFAKTNF